LLCSILW